MARHGLFPRKVSPQDRSRQCNSQAGPSPHQRWRAGRSLHQHWRAGPSLHQRWRAGPSLHHVGGRGLTASALAGGAVTAPALASGAVTAPALAVGAVTAPALAGGAVHGGHVVDGSLTRADLGDAPRVASFENPLPETMIFGKEVVVAQVNIVAPSAGRVIVNASGFFVLPDPSTLESVACSFSTSPFYEYPLSAFVEQYPGVASRILCPLAARARLASRPVHRRISD